MTSHLEVICLDCEEKGDGLSMASEHDDPQTLRARLACWGSQRASPGLGSEERGHYGLVQVVEAPPDRPVSMSHNEQLHDPTLSLKYCSVHQRAWVEALGQWVAFPEPIIDGSPVMEVACDTCTVFVFQTFRAQFPALYACSP
jgi:hypothetical protein